MDTELSRADEQPNSLSSFTATMPLTSTVLWHRRLGHLNFRAMDLMVKNELVTGIHLGRLKNQNGHHVCEGCLIGKQNEHSFPKNKPKRSNQLLELVHSDLVGPMPVKTIFKHRYCVTFIDDHSRKVWVYPLVHKDQVFDCFLVWKAMVENISGFMNIQLLTLLSRMD
jgi:hypothetical protein